MTGMMKAWRVHAYGPPLTALQCDDVPIPEPGPGEVRVRNLAFPLNLNDLERIQGGNMMAAPTLPAIPGMEVMGVVHACGPGAEGIAGKRVAAIAKQAQGAFAEYTICPAAAAFETPAEIPLPDAAAILFPFHLAWLGLFDRAGLRGGQSVLIHAAAGGSGSAAIQLAREAGARVFATVGSDEKIQLCRDLGAEVVINYRTEDFAGIVLEQTGGKGVDVVFDNVGEAVMDKSMHVIAYNGHYLMMGFASNKRVADERFITPRKVAMGNFHLSGVLLSYAPPQAATAVKRAAGFNFPSSALGAEIHKAIVDRVMAGKLKPVIGAVVPFAEAPAACAALAARQTVGRTIVQVAT